MSHGRLSRITTTFVAACLLALSVPGVANAAGDVEPREPAGQYTYVCISTSGSSYILAPGAALSTCKGSYLHKYINGVKVLTIPLTGYGTPVNPNSVSMDCLIAIVGTGASVLTLGGGWSYVGLAASVYGLNTCRA